MKSYNWVRRLIGGLSFTTALFVFQACYGPPQGRYDILINGQVKDKQTGEPIKGVKVSVDSTSQYTYANEIGKFSFYVQDVGNIKIKFEDVDSTLNGSYNNRDTTIYISRFNEDVYLNVLMEGE